MLDFAFFHKPFQRSHGRQMLLCFVWLLGLLFGYGLSASCKPYFLPLMYSLFSQSVSIVGLLQIVSLPTLCIFLSLLFKNSIVLWIVFFIDAVAFSFSLGLLSSFLGSAFWLIGTLTVLSDGLLSLLLLFFLLITADDTPQTKLRAVFLFFCAEFLIVSMDYFVISPFMMGIFR